MIHIAKRKLLSLVLAFAMLMALLPPGAAAATAEGTCGSDGDNVTWVLDETGTHTISGSGEAVCYEIDLRVSDGGARYKDAHVSRQLAARF